jgi:hypothetical protein
VNPESPAHWWNNGAATGTKLGVAEIGNTNPWNFSNTAAVGSAPASGRFDSSAATPGVAAAADGTWDPSGPNGGGGWGDSNNDMYNVYSQYSINGMGAVRPTDSIWTKLIRYTGVLTKDYTRIIQELRQRNGYEDDDTIADEIISSAITRASLFSAAGSAITGLIPRKTNDTGMPDPMSMGYGDFLALLGIPAEAAALMIIQISAVMQIASLYSELPADDDERVDIASIPFAM